MTTRRSPHATRETGQASARAPRPFRTEPRALTEAELRAATDAYRRPLSPDPSWRLDPDAQGPLVRQILAPVPSDYFAAPALLLEGIPSLPPRLIVPDRFEEWANHPDERVAVIMIQHMRRLAKTDPTYQGPMPVYHRFIDITLNNRAFAINETECLLWNPLLDALAVTGAVATSYNDPAATPRRPVAEMCQDLVPWIVAQTDARELDGLLKFKYAPLRTLVYEHARVIGPKWPAKVRGEMAHALARNPNLTAADRDRMATAGAATYRKAETVVPDDEGMWPDKPWRGDAMETVSEVFALLDGQGHRVPDAALAPFLAGMRNTHPAYQEELQAAAYAVLRNLTHTLDDQQRFTLALDRISTDSYNVVVDLKAYLLAPTRTAEEVRDGLTRLIEANIAIAAALLNNHHDLLLPKLTPDILQPFLSSEHAVIRQQAMLHLGAVGLPSAGNRPASPDRGPKTR